MNLMGVVYEMIGSFISLDLHIDLVTSPIDSPHMSVPSVPLIWATVTLSRSIPIISGLTVVSATTLPLLTNLKSIFYCYQINLSNSSVEYLFYQHGRKITR